MLGATAAADDVAQEALLRLWQSGPSLDGRTEPRQVLAWLYLTSTRLCLDALRRARALIPLGSTPPLTCAASTHEELS
jgi:RNA polymerase sigma-70 factor (ECF subfamily)